jgi:hypothetical protein
VLERAGVTQSLNARVLQALQVLDLIDDSGMPTPTFEGIRLASEAEYKKRLEDWLKSTYADIFSFVDPATDDETSIRDAFRSYQPVGQQERMVSLFQGLARAAGLLPEKTSAPRSASRPRSSSSPAPRRSPPRPMAKPMGGGNASLGLPAPLAGLLSSLPPEGEGWTSATRDKFMDTFGAVLDFCIPVKPTANTTKENGGQD